MKSSCDDKPSTSSEHSSISIEIASDEQSFPKSALRNPSITPEWKINKRVRWWDMTYGGAADCLENSLCCKYYTLILASLSVPILLALSIALLVFYFQQPHTAIVVLSGFFFLVTCAAFSWSWRECVSYRMRKHSFVQRARHRPIRRRRSSAKRTDLEVSLDPEIDDRLSLYRTLTAEMADNLLASATTQRVEVATQTPDSRKGKHRPYGAFYKKGYSSSVPKLHVQEHCKGNQQ